MDERRQMERMEQAQQVNDEERQLKLKKSQEEYDEWRHLFEEVEMGVQNELTNEEEDDAGEDNGQNAMDVLTSKMIQFIQSQKVVMIEMVASHFQVKIDQVIQWIHQWVKSGQLTGILDDRGKFIYISEEELDNVSKYIEREGRVSIRQLSQESNRLISLKPSP